MIFKSIVVSGVLPLLLLVPVRRAVRRAAGITAAASRSARLELRLEAALRWLAWPCDAGAAEQGSGGQQASSMSGGLQITMRLVAVFAACCVAAEQLW